MTRQHTAPVVVNPAGIVSQLVQVRLDGQGTYISEGKLQQLIAESPDVLPLSEIDSEFHGAIHLCREMRTSAGLIDHVLVTKRGHLVLVECKLWRNPQARREVVGQIIDYAACISRYTCSDLQRDVNQRLQTTGDTVFEMVRARYPDVEQIAFNDALSRNLRVGRMMLLIVGDGIREGVETIAEYLTKHSGLNFTLGLVELPMFELPEGSIVVTPRSFIGRSSSAENRQTRQLWKPIKQLGSQTNMALPRLGRKPVNSGASSYQVSNSATPLNHWQNLQVLGTCTSACRSPVQTLGFGSTESLSQTESAYSSGTNKEHSVKN
jgi:hypothetical protein